MSGYFELVDAPDGGYRIRLLDGSGALMAISITFPTKRAAVAGVAKAREIAGTGLIRDHCRDRVAPSVQVPPGRKHTNPVRKKSAGSASRAAASAGLKQAVGHP